MLLLSMFISHIPPPNVSSFVFQKLVDYLMFRPSYFKSSLSTISIKRVNAMPLRSNIDVVLKIMTIAELFIVMTTATG